MNLLTGETTLSGVGLDDVTLTTHRVRYAHQASDGTKVVSITLDAVSSCGLISKSYPVLLLLAGIFAVAGVFMVNQGIEDGNLRNGVFLTAIALGIAYFLSRTVSLSIASPGDSITVSARGLKPDVLIGVIDAVEQAKLRYLGKAAD